MANSSIRNHLLEDILRNVANELFVLSIDSFNLLDVNEKALENLGYSHTELKDMSMPAIQPEYSENMMKELIEPLKSKNAKQVQYATLHSRKDGSRYSTLLKLVLSEWEGEEVLLAIGQNITEETQSNKLLVQNQKMESIGLMAERISHDLNNILHGISLGAELTLSDLDKESRAWDNLSRITSYATKGKELVKQIQTFTRAGDETMEALDLISIVRDSMKLIRRTTPSRIRFSQKLPETAMHIMGDSASINQVVTNLCNNAFQSMGSQNGLVTIEVEKRDLSNKTDLYNTVPDGEYIQLSVSDNGCGISSDIRDKIFDPFFTTKQKTKGMGLGLSVVHRIVKNHRGFIRLEDKEKGSTFNVFFPVIKMDTEVVEVQEVKSLQGQEHILLVDDEHVNLTLQKRMMERLGYKVSAFSDGNEALKMLEKDSGEFDLLITDQTMPDISGMQLAEKAVALREEFPVIISSGYADSMRLEQGEDTIISAFIAKPYTKEEISITIRKVLDK